MIFKRFNRGIIVRVSLMAAVALLLSWYFLLRGFDITVVCGIALYIFQTADLVRFFNRTNRHLTHFFDAVKNEDSALVFNQKSGNRDFDRLSQSLNILNQKLQEARMEIEMRERYFMAVVESASTALIVFDSQGEVHLANSAARMLLGVDNIHSLNQVGRVAPRLKGILEGCTEGESATIHVSLKNSPAYLLVSCSTIELRGKMVKITALQDISQELDRQEVDSWQKLIRILNHEIMNSVAPITSLSATLSGFFKRDGRAVKPGELGDKAISNTIRGLGVIEEHGKGLIEFVNSYRSITRLPRPEPSDIRVSTIFDKVSVLASSLIESLGDNRGKGITISNQVYPDDLEVFADEELITRVVFNLVKNGIESFDKFHDAVVFLEAGRNRDGRVWIRITDNGPGIPDDVIDNVFVPFFTTREGGSGIGLSLSRQIVLMHKGTLKLFSNPGEGTTALISF